MYGFSSRLEKVGELMIGETGLKKISTLKLKETKGGKYKIEHMKHRV